MGNLRKQIMGNPYCEFCSTLKFERSVLQERCDRYNFKAHVKSGRANSGVIINNYITDHKTRVYEKKTKTFTKLRFCPICGYDYVEGKQYDGRLYIFNDFNKYLAKLEDAKRKK